MDRQAHAGDETADQREGLPDVAALAGQSTGHDGAGPRPLGLGSKFTAKRQTPDSSIEMVRGFVFSGFCDPFSITAFGAILRSSSARKPFVNRRRHEDHKDRSLQARVGSGHLPARICAVLCPLRMGAGRSIRQMGLPIVIDPFAGSGGFRVGCRLVCPSCPA